MKQIIGVPNLLILPFGCVAQKLPLSQQAQILQLHDYRTCSPEWKEKLQEKASSLVAIYTKPVYIFKELLNFLEHHRIVLTGYSFMQEEVIGRALTDERKRLEQAVINGIAEEQRAQLDNLLAAEESLHQLTLLKHEPKDFSHREIQREVERLSLIH